MRILIFFLLSVVLSSGIMAQSPEKLNEDRGFLKVNFDSTGTAYLGRVFKRGGKYPLKKYGFHGDSCRFEQVDFETVVLEYYKDQLYTANFRVENKKKSAVLLEYFKARYGEGEAKNLGNTIFWITEDINLTYEYNPITDYANFYFYSRIAKNRYESYQYDKKYGKK